MDTTDSLRKRMGSRKDAPAWVARAGMMVALAGVLTACGGQPSAPATTAPAATTIPATDATEAPADEATATVEETMAPAADEQAASPAAGAGMATPMAGASPVAALATPVMGVGATPIASAMASPAAEATPVESVAYSGANCAAVSAWMSQPEVAKTLETPLWPEVLAEGMKAAAGETFNVKLMQTDAASLDGVATTMRTLAGDDVKQDAVAATSQLVGHTAKLANGLADGSDTPAETQEKVKALEEAIATYDADASAQLAACGV
jgi:hypothetical protein